MKRHINTALTIREQNTAAVKSGQQVAKAGKLSSLKPGDRIDLRTQKEHIAKAEVNCVYLFAVETCGRVIVENQHAETGFSIHIEGTDALAKKLGFNSQEQFTEHFPGPFIGSIVTWRLVEEGQKDTQAGIATGGER